MNQKEDSGEILLILLLLLGIYLNKSWITLFIVVVLTVNISAKVLRDRSLDKVSYQRKWFYQKGFPEEKSHFNLEIKNQKRIPLTWLRSSDPWPAQVEIDEKEHIAHSQSSDWDRLVNAYSMQGKSKINRKFNYTFKKRGVYPIGPVRLESGDPFGYYQNIVENNSQEYLTVYPQILTDVNLEIPAEDPTGLRQTAHSIFQDVNQPVGVRPYQREDSFRIIHWPATARSGEMQSKLYQPILSKVMVIILNVSTTAKPWLGTSHKLTEQLISVAASLAYQNFQKGYSIGVVSNGCLAHSDHPFLIMPGRSREHLSLILESLAAVTPYITCPFEEYLLQSIPKIPYGSTIVVVTGLITPLLMETLTRLKFHRNQLALVSLEQTPPPEIPGVFMAHLPFSEEG